MTRSLKDSRSSRPRLSADIADRAREIRKTLGPPEAPTSCAPEAVVVHKAVPLPRGGSAKVVPLDTEDTKEARADESDDDDAVALGRDEPRFECPCGAVVPLERRAEHFLRSCFVYRESWAESGRFLLQAHGRDATEDRVRRVIDARSCGHGEAFCALCECRGDVGRAVEKLGDDHYWAEMALAASASGWEKGDFFSPFEARISASFHSFRLIWTRDHLSSSSRRVLDEWTLSLTHSIAYLTS